jgi:probable HAF family extracellular repeat protein
MRRVLFGGTVLALLLSPAVGRVKADGPAFVVQDLGAIDGNVPNVTGINTSGQVSGWYSAADGDHAVRYTDGKGWVAIPGLESMSAYALGINDHGDVAGYAILPTGDMRAFRYVDGSPVEFIDPMPGGSFTLATGINNAGDITGYGNDSTGVHGFRRAPGAAPQSLMGLGGSFSAGCAINDNGDVAGTAMTAAGVQHAFRETSTGSVVDISGLNGSSSFSTSCGIDAAGAISGQGATSTGAMHAFLFTTGTPSDVDSLGSASSVGSGIAAGIMVGTSTASDGSQLAFRYTTDDGMVDLNTLLPDGSGWELAMANAVNASGTIVGEGLFNGNFAAYRMAPVAASEPPPPADTTAPTIASVSVSPAQIHPDKRMVPVTVSVTAADDSGSDPSCSITSITSTHADGNDAEITGDLTASVRAELDPRGETRTYTLEVTCGDAAQNVTTGTVTVDVKGARRLAHGKAIRVAHRLWKFHGRHHGNRGGKDHDNGKANGNGQGHGNGHGRS